MYEDFFGYERGQPGSTWGYSEIAKLHKFYKATTILNTIEECYDNIRYAMDHKQFKNEHAMMSYAFAIIKNNIKKVYDREKRIEKKKEALNDKSYEIVDEIIETDNSIHVNAANDISGFLGGDE